VRIIFAMLVLSRLAAAEGIEANAQRGAVVFKEQKCTMCHIMLGTGKNASLQFEQGLGREYTPAGMASRMWNHAPRMWAAIREAGLDVPPLTEVQAADLFAFFYASHSFEWHGDATCGKKVFEDKCANCHCAQGAGRPVAELELPADSVELVQKLWNHASEMCKVLKTRKRHWPQLASQELADLLIYMQNLPENRSSVHTFTLPTGEGGKALLESKGCTGCHMELLALEGRLAQKTLTDIAASMWNHAPAMREKAAELSVDEMREILAYVWSAYFFRSPGNVADGRNVFNSRCGICHANPLTVAPNLATINRRHTAITMVWALLNHGPKMLQEMEMQEQDWPALSEVDMENLIAFLDFRLSRRVGAAHVTASSGVPVPD
jgi:cytochrome c2